MQVWRAAFFMGLGGIVALNGDIHGPGWPLLLTVGGLGWAWTAIGATAKRVWNGLIAALTGRPQALPTTDPKALTAEIAAGLCVVTNTWDSPFCNLPTRTRWR